MSIDAELKRRADRRVNILTQIADLQADLKQLKAEDKVDGYDEKAMGVIIRALLKGPDAHADQLAFELVVDTYRAGVGLTTTLEDAQAEVRNSVTSMPGHDSHDERELEDA